MPSFRLPACLLLLWVADVSAGTPDDIRDAYERIRKVDEEGAIRLLTRALDRGDATPSQKGEIYALLGLARFNLLDQEGARLAFEKAFDAYPPVALPPGAPPKARVLFDEVRVEAARARRQREIAEREAAAKRAAELALLQKAQAGRPWTFYAATGVGVIGLAGGVAGVVGIGQAWSARTNAVRNNDALAAEQQFQRANDQYRLSQVLLIGGVTLTAASVGYLFWPRKAPEKKKGAQVFLGPSSIAVAGEF
jgi:hypothetical protein